MNEHKTFFAICLFCAFFCTALQAQNTLNQKTIAAFGSSVCNGTGDAGHGYIQRLKERMQKEGWNVIQLSRGGDNTVKIQQRFEPLLDENSKPLPNQKGRFLFPAMPSDVIIGLSLGNELFQDKQFQKNLPELVEKCRQKGMRVVIGGCYAHGAMTPEKAQKTHETNILIGQMDLPSINFLGSVDDGLGRWTEGLYSDRGHPNAQGHTEMFHAIVPSIWPALLAGKTPPKRNSAGSMNLDKKALLFQPQDPIHAFAEVFWLRMPAEGVVASIQALPVLAKDENTGSEDKPKILRQFTPDEKAQTISLKVQDGQLLYTGLENQTIKAPLTEGWCMVALSHWYARGESELYVNGALVGSLKERYQALQWSLERASFKEWFIYRSALNADEVAHLHKGGIFRSSLEMYAPLEKDCLDNLAQSLSTTQLIPSKAP